MFFVSWKLALMMLAVGPLMLAPIILSGRRVQRLSRASQDSMIGASINGPTASIISASFQLTKNIRSNAPMVVAVVRRATEIDEPIRVSISVVSVVRRETTSPVRTLT